MELTEVLTRNRSFVFALALKLVEDATLADEVLQKTWIAAWESGKAKIALPRPWLARVARNFSLELLRTRAGQRRRDEKAARSELVGETAAEVAASEEIRRVVVDAVLRLEEPERTVILLRYYKEMPLDSIARQLGRTIPSVRYLKGRGLAALRRELDSRYGSSREWFSLLVPLALLSPSTGLQGGVMATIGDAFTRAVTVAGQARAVVVSGAALLVTGLVFLLAPASKDVDLMPGGETAHRAVDSVGMLKADVDADGVEPGSAEIVSLVGGLAPAAAAPVPDPEPDPLSPPAAIVGVHHQGRAIEDAIVTLHPATRPPCVVHDFSGRMLPRFVAEARTDGTGQGCLIPFKDRDGEEIAWLPLGFTDRVFLEMDYHVRVEADGFAPWISDPIPLSPEGRCPFRRAELLRGGSLRGRVVTRPDQAPESLVVKISRGDGFPRCVRAGRDGTYAFDRLAPGAWEGTYGTEEYGPVWETTTMTDAPPALFTFSILDRQETECDVDARVPVTGDLLISLPAWADGGRARLTVLNGPCQASQRVRPAVTRGAAFFGDLMPVEYGLTIEEIPGNIRLTRTIRITVGKNAWSDYDPLLGDLEVRGCPELPGEEMRFFHRDEKGILFTTALEPDASGWALLRNVPVGTGCIKKKAPRSGWRLVRDDVTVPGTVDLGE